MAANSKTEKRLLELEWKEHPSIPFADYVQVSTASDVGSVLTFAQKIASKEKAQIVAEVFIPHSAAAKLVCILLAHLKNVEKDTKRKILPDDIQVELRDDGD